MKSIGSSTLKGTQLYFSLFLPLYDITQFLPFLIKNLFLGPLCRRPLRLVTPIELSSRLGVGLWFLVSDKEIAQVIPIKPDEEGNKPHDQRKDDIEKQRPAPALPLLLLLRHVNSILSRRPSPARRDLQGKKD